MIKRPKYLLKVYFSIYGCKFYTQFSINGKYGCQTCGSAWIHNGRSDLIKYLKSCDLYSNKIQLVSYD